MWYIMDCTEDAYLLFLSGQGTIHCGEEQLTFQKGDSFFLPADSGKYEITGCCEALITSIRELAET